ncbi:MAG: c-type cytochrome, partial [Bryobacteraceae bacterium]|nr:c-type cytochrome [Bryobacteraceae bacterium]
MRTTVPLLILFVAHFPAAGVDVVVPDADYLTSAEAVVAGQKLFAAACGACHGRSGEGARGPNLADGGLIRRLNNTRLFASIKNGVPGTDMPGFPMADAKIWQIVAFVRSLSSPAIEARLEGDVPRGSAVFFGAGGCSGCHSIRGRGASLGPDLSNAGAVMTV